MNFRFTPQTAREVVEHATCTLCPVVDRITGDNRRALAHIEEMDRPAVYVATFKDDNRTYTYVGMTGCAQERPLGPHLAGADHIYVIADAEDRLDRRDLMVLERSGFAWLETLNGYAPTHQERPNAEAVGQRRFAQLQGFLSSALLIVQARGWEFQTVPAGQLARHPRAYDEMARVTDRSFPPGGDIVRLSKVGVHARAIWLGEAAGLILFPQSTVRREIVRSAPKILGARREELVHTGVLTQGDWGEYRLSRMLWFDNFTAAGAFVTGSCTTLRDWRLVRRLGSDPGLHLVP